MASREERLARAPPVHNYVDRDRLWKDNVEKCNTTMYITWPARWGFLPEEYTKLREAMEGKRPMSPYDMRNWFFPPPPKKAKQGLILPPIDDRPLITTIPKTASGWYGYKPKIKGRSLVTERVKWCTERHGVTSLHKAFKWPDIYD